MKTPDFDWRMLHDAVLAEVAVERESEVIRVRLRLSSATPRVAEITMRGFTFLSFPNRSPWGPSASVNAAKASPSGSKPVRLEIEMQSGDVLEIEGGELTVVVSEPS
jgi:hypothetical protein